MGSNNSSIYSNNSYEGMRKLVHIKKKLLLQEKLIGKNLKKVMIII